MAAVVFFGSDNFATTSLEALLVAGHKVVACVTPPDRAQGRGMHVVASPVKVTADQHAIPIFQPDNIHDPAFAGELRQFNADFFVVIAYGKILPENLLKIPRHCALNVHASLLPKYRGAAPINWAIIHGEKETGVTVMRLNARMDAGDIVGQKTTPIADEEDAQTLRLRLAKIGAQLLVETLAIPVDKWVFKTQDEQIVSRAPKLTKEMGHIDWAQTAVAIHDLIRGLQPWPAAHAFFDGKMIKILATESWPVIPVPGQPGEVVEISDAGFVVATGKGALLVKTVHPESSHAMPAVSFAAGHHLKKGARFS